MATPARPRFWPLRVAPLVGAREAEAPADPVAEAAGREADPEDREAEPEAAEPEEEEPVRVVRDAVPTAPLVVLEAVPLETPAPTMEVEAGAAVEDATSVEVFAAVETTATVVELGAPEEVDSTATTAEEEELAEEVAAAASEEVLLAGASALPPVILNWPV